MNEEQANGEVLTIDGESKHPVIIHIHGDGAEININVTHHHCPAWLDEEAVMRIIEGMRTK